MCGCEAIVRWSRAVVVRWLCGGHDCVVVRRLCGGGRAVLTAVVVQWSCGYAMNRQFHIHLNSFKLHPDATVVLDILLKNLYDCTNDWL